MPGFGDALVLGPGALDPERAAALAARALRRLREVGGVRAVRLAGDAVVGPHLLVYVGPDAGPLPAEVEGVPVVPRRIGGSPPRSDDRAGGLGGSPPRSDDRAGGLGGGEGEA
jgi:hypothetical protein